MLSVGFCGRKILVQRSVPVDVYIVGGYLGEPVADDLSQTLLSTLHSSPQSFRVVLGCISALNSLRCGHTSSDIKASDEDSVDTRESWVPRRTSLAVELSSGRAFPVRFEGSGRGAGFDVRGAMLMAEPREEPFAEVRK